LIEASNFAFGFVDFLSTLNLMIAQVFDYEFTRATPEQHLLHHNIITRQRHFLPLRAEDLTPVITVIA
jgi:hypothetical protein